MQKVCFKGLGDKNYTIINMLELISIPPISANKEILERIDEK